MFFAVVVDGEAGTLGEDLWEVVSAGLIVPLTASESLQRGTPYRFAHDRVQEAAHAMLSSQDERELAHLKIGRVLLASLQDPDHGGRVRGGPPPRRRGRTHHRRRGAPAARRPELSGRSPRPPGDRLFGRRGAAALRHRAVARARLGRGLRLELRAALRVHGGRAPRRALRGRRAPRCAADRPRPHGPREGADDLLRVGLETSRGENQRALEIGRAGLALLGVDLPKHGSAVAVAGRSAVVQVRLLGRSAEDLAGLPAMDDPIAASRSTC